MKTTYITFAFVALFAVGCSSPTQLASRPDRVKDPSQKGMPSRLERVDYDWEKYGIQVSFHRLDDNLLWRVNVEDSWSIYDQLTKVERAWEVSQCKCSTEQCLQMIDRSLALFHAEKPDAKLETLALEMQVVRELWAETLAGLNRALSTVNTAKARSGADIPDEVGEELRRMASTSAPIEKIKALLARRGMSPRGPYPSTLTFKDSLTGHKWSDIGKLPDAGVLLPGIFEFDLGASNSGGKEADTSQSVLRR